MIHLTWSDIDKRIRLLDLKGKRVWGIPRGGAIVAAMARNNGAILVENPTDADVALDDIIDSGATAEKTLEKYGLETIALIDKHKEGITDWVHFAWEEPPEQDIEESVRRIIEYISDNPKRDGLIDTPSRVVKSWSTLFEGYTEDASTHLVWFEDNTDEMIISRDIQFYSTCEHHMLPFFGTVSIGYIPNGKVIGISKLSRIVNIYARRFQIQERMTRQIGELIEPHVEGVAVNVKGQHLCMMARGVNQQATDMVTNYLTGVFRSSAETRAEFLGALNGK